MREIITVISDKHTVVYMIRDTTDIRPYVADTDTYVVLQSEEKSDD